MYGTAIMTSLKQIDSRITDVHTCEVELSRESAVLAEANQVTIAPHIECLQRVRVTYVACTSVVVSFMQKVIER
jgi:hypothetical protein